MNKGKAIYRYSDLEAMGFGCRATIWSRCKRGDFPAPIDAGGRPAWLPEEIDEWIARCPHIQYGNTVTA